MNFIYRHNKILELLEHEQVLYVDKLSQLLHVSPNTIRNDLNMLSKKGLLIKIHGGATSIHYVVEKRVDRLNYRINQNISFKQAIAKQVVANLPKDEFLTLFMDSSTTVLEIANELRQYPHKITIITNFYLIPMALNDNPNITVIMIGGTWWKDEYCTIGKLALDTLSLYPVSIALLGCKGLIIEDGILNIYDLNTDVTAIKKRMIGFAQQTWICADSTKFNQKSYTHIASIDNITTFATDTPPSLEYRHLMEQKNVSILYPPE